MSTKPIWNRQLIRAIRDQFRIDWHGYHGIWHWQNVRRNAHAINASLAEAGKPTADPVVLDLFALFHDSARVNEYTDTGHGTRGAMVAQAMRGTHFDCTDEQMAQLVAACDGHSRGQVSADPTIGVCWDADRLDLIRVGITAEAEYLSFSAQSRQCPVFKRSIERAFIIERRIHNIRRLREQKQAA